MERKTDGEKGGRVLYSMERDRKKAVVYGSKG